MTIAASLLCAAWPLWALTILMVSTSGGPAVRVMMTLSLVIAVVFLAVPHDVRTKPVSSLTQSTLGRLFLLLLALIGGVVLIEFSF